MSQALHTASTGINAGQAQINVIANNVANINTVAYKSANMTFETLFSNNLSYGSAATKEGGGTNPMQIGLGVKIGGISRNFEIGTFVNTGRDTDVMISGNGYFVVQDGDGKQYYTRDGVFTTDSNGNLVTQSGMKVVGASSPYSDTASSKTVKVPTNLKATVDPTKADDIKVKLLGDLNNSSISSGQMNLVLYNDKGVPISHAMTLTVDPSKTVGQNIEAFNAQFKVAKYVPEYEPKMIQDPDTGELVPEKDAQGNIVYETDVDGNKIPKTDAEGNIIYATDPNTGGLIPETDAQGNIVYDNADPMVEAIITNDGRISFVPKNENYKIKFDPIDTNFLAETGISDKNYLSDVLNYSAVVQDLLDYNDPNGIAVSSVTIIDENGIISASYSDGSNLTTQINEDGQAEWRFTTSDGVIITGTDVTTKGSIDKDSNFIIELASFINEEGLVSLNNNLWEWGPDAGEIFYGMAGEMAFGSLESGGYEGSNVDIAMELSNMITAQRMIQMNSRVFSTASSVMETLAYLGQ